MTRYDVAFIASPEERLPHLEDVANLDALSHCTKKSSITASAVSLRVGLGDAIYRWKKGSVLAVYVDSSSFPNEEDYSVAKQAFKSALEQWNDMRIGVTIKFTSDINAAVFELVYSKDISGSHDRTYARSFGPCDPPGERTLFIYARSFKSTVVKFMSNTFCHEIGHILGLRHENAHHRETGDDVKSYRFGPANQRSVMNSYPPWMLQIDQQDIKSAQDFYAYDEDFYAGVPIVDVEPEYLYVRSYVAVPYV